MASEAMAEAETYEAEAAAQLFGEVVLRARAWLQAQEKG